MTTKQSYTTKQMIHTLSNNGESIRTIADALGIPKSTVHRVLKGSMTQEDTPELIGNGCYTTSTKTGELVDMLETDYDEGLSMTQPGELTHIDSGYPDIYYNEKAKRWEVWLGSKRVWRATSLVKACEVRLAKGGLSKDEEKLLQAVVEAPVELQEALNYPPI